MGISFCQIDTEIRSGKKKLFEIELLISFIIHQGVIYLPQTQYFALKENKLPNKIKRGRDNGKYLQNYVF